MRRRAASDAMRDAVLRLRAEGIGPTAIAERLGISKGTCTGYIFRSEHPEYEQKRYLNIKKAPPPSLVPVDLVPIWGTPEADDLLVADAGRGCLHSEIATRWGFTRSKVRHRLDRIRLGKTVKSPKPEPPSVPVKFKRKKNSAQFQVFNSIFSRRGAFKAQTAPPKNRDGLCIWPLTCDDVATHGRLCADHAALLDEPPPQSKWEMTA